VFGRPATCTKPNQLCDGRRFGYRCDRTVVSGRAKIIALTGLLQILAPGVDLPAVGSEAEAAPSRALPWRDLVVQPNGPRMGRGHGQGIEPTDVAHLRAFSAACRYDRSSWPCQSRDYEYDATRLRRWTECEYDAPRASCPRTECEYDAARPRRWTECKYDAVRSPARGPAWNDRLGFEDHWESDERTQAGREYDDTRRTRDPNAYEDSVDLYACGPGT
jgi:hypothetical protein